MERINSAGNQMNIDWRKCLLQSRCQLNLINLNSEHFDNLLGVYVIWSGNDVKRIISVGQGAIRDRLIDMQINKKVRGYGPGLFVTWAEVPKASLEGVEAFLCKKLNPLVHQNITCLDFINVNLPSTI